MFFFVFEGLQDALGLLAAELLIRLRLLLLLLLLVLLLLILVLLLLVLLLMCMLGLNHISSLGAQGTSPLVPVGRRTFLPQAWQRTGKVARGGTPSRRRDVQEVEPG